MPSGARERRAPVGVRSLLVSNLLNGGFGYEDHNSRFRPLWRSTIGFDHFFDLVDAAQRAGSEDHYPPYNIERLGDDSYQISLAVAGFGPDDIAVTAEQNVLTIEGQKPDKEQREYLYQGISARHFKRQFNLADYVQVKNASFENGLLRIELARRNPRGYEAPADPDQRDVSVERPAARRQSGLTARRSTKRLPRRVPRREPCV